VYLLKCIVVGLFLRHEVVSFSYITAVKGSIFKGNGIACSLQDNCNIQISVTYNNNKKSLNYKVGRIFFCEILVITMSKAKFD